MILEYLCPHCETTNIFKQIGRLSEKNCRKCERKLNVQKDLVRYERDKDGDIEIILHERVETLIIAVGDIADRLAILEKSVLGDADDEEIVTIN